MLPTLTLGCFADKLLPFSPSLFQTEVDQFLSVSVLQVLEQDGGILQSVPVPNADGQPAVLGPRHGADALVLYELGFVLLTKFEIVITDHDAGFPALCPGKIGHSGAKDQQEPFHPGRVLSAGNRKENESETYEREDAVEDEQQDDLGSFLVVLRPDHGASGKLFLIVPGCVILGFVPFTKGTGIAASAGTETVPEHAQHNDEQHRNQDTHRFFGHIVPSFKSAQL